jgi:RNA polymerase sigma factor (sigma-70 family)
LANGRVDDMAMIWIPWGEARTENISFEHLLAPHIDPLYRLAYRFTGKREEAEDLVQDLLIRLFPRHAELCQVEKLRPWLARVLYRIFIDRRRAASRSPIDFPDTDPEVEHQMDSSPGPEHLADESLTRERLERALEELNDDQRVLLALHDVEGYTLVELAEMLEVPIGTLKSRLSRAHNRLREFLSMEPFSATQRVSN